VELADRTKQRVLNEIVRIGGVSRQGDREAAKVPDAREHGREKLLLCRGSDGRH
jgi:hypothetical protein